jgi:hypothetical protein
MYGDGSNRVQMVGENNGNNDEGMMENELISPKYMCMFPT